MRKKKKQSSVQSIEKSLSKITKELEKKNFKTIEEANEYIRENLNGKKINFLDDEELSNPEKAQDLIWDARELEYPEDRIELALEALKLDKNCADAYNLLAEEKAETTEEAMEFYFKAIEAGKKSLGKDFDKFKGGFWGFHETRPFMRAMAGLASEYLFNEQIQDAINIWEEMLELNPMDNQGVRYALLTELLTDRKYKKAENLINQYKDDYSAVWFYSRAYLFFNLKSKKELATKSLIEAMKFNPYVPLYIFGLEEMPDEMPEYISVGGKSEAISYVDSSIYLWSKNRKALVWLAHTHKKYAKELESIIKENEEKEKQRIS